MRTLKKTSLTALLTLALGALLAGPAAADPEFPITRCVVVGEHAVCIDHT